MGRERSILRVPNIPRAMRVGNLKKLISAVVPGLQSRFVFAFSDLFSHVGSRRTFALYGPRSSAYTYLYAESVCVFVAEFDLSNMRGSRSMSIDEKLPILFSDKCGVGLKFIVYIFHQTFNDDKYVRDHVSSM